MARKRKEEVRQKSEVAKDKYEVSRERSGECREKANSTYCKCKRGKTFPSPKEITDEEEEGGAERYGGHGGGSQPSTGEDTERGGKRIE